MLLFTFANAIMDKLYIDIDGVLLTPKHHKPADDLGAFCDYLTKTFDCYWRTTHCRDNDAQPALHYLSQYLSQDILKLLTKIKPTKWDALKTEAIDFCSNFVWIDDFVFESEKKQLEEFHCIDRLILVNLQNDNELLRVKDYLFNHIYI